MDRRILILKTGEFPLQLRKKHGPYEQAFYTLLGEERFLVVDVRKEALPRANWMGILVTGSESSTYNRDTWIRKSEDFLRRAADRKTPIYGICFGHQLIAQTFGGKVERCSEGWELGTVSIRVTPEAQGDLLLNGLPEYFLAQQSHGDVVTQLPPGAVRLATNSHCRIQAFRLGDNIWGTQFHPEFNRGIMTDLAQYLIASLGRKAVRFPPVDRFMKERVLSPIRETPQAKSCLQKFVRYAEERRGFWPH